MRQDVDAWVAAGLFLFALGLRVGVLALWPFDGLYGQDPYAYYDYARQIFGLIRGGSLAGSFYWPLGYPALAAVLFPLTGVTPLAGQVLSLVMGSLVAPLVYLISREMLWDDAAGGRWAGLAAGSVAGACGQLIQSSLVWMADAPALFWATFSLWALLRFARLQRGPWLVLAAASLALATVTRWVMGLLALPWSLYLLALVAHQEPVDWRRWLSSGSFALACGALILLPQLRLSAATPQSFAQHPWVRQWSPANALRRAFDNPDGHFEYPLPVAVFNLQAFYHPFYLFPLLTPLAFLGAWVQRRSRAMILVVGWIVSVYGFLIGIPYENFRFPLAYATPVALLVGFGFGVLLSARARWAWGALALSLIAMLAVAARGLLFDPRSVLAIKQRDLASIAWLQERLPPGARVITMGVTLTLQTYSDFEAIEIYREDPASLAARVCGKTAYAYLDTGAVEGQWKGLSPEADYRWLRDGPGLTALGRFQNYTLFEVGDVCK